MNCKQAQRLILSDAANSDVQRHLADCSDCRVAQQRALRLQQLLTVKRHETPGQHYFDGFLDNFHRRLATTTAPQPTFWQRCCARLRIEPVPRLRYGFAHALGVAFAVALVSRTWITADLPINHAAEDSIAPQIATSSLPAPQSMPRMIAASLPAQPAAPTALVFPALATRPGFDAPRYVLDRFSLTPASYEVANIHF